MLKNISFGQYIPGDSLIHKLDPRVKILLTFSYILVLFMISGGISYAILTAYLLILTLFSKINIGMLLKTLKPVLLLILITTLLNIFYIREGTELLHWGPILITDLGLETAFLIVLRIFLLIIGTYVLLTYTTSPVLLTDALESLGKPFKKIKVPVHELSMIMTIALRFIPTLIEETDKIMSAQKSRGADFESGSLLKRSRALIPILVPLFVSAFRRAEELSIAMESRCYRGDINRTTLKLLKMETRDYVLLLTTLLVYIAAFIF